MKKSLLSNFTDCAFCGQRGGVSYTAFVEDGLLAEVGFPVTVRLHNFCRETALLTRVLVDSWKLVGLMEVGHNEVA